MPKRKRDWNGAPAEVSGGSARQQRIDHKLQQGTRKLAHAFKVAKGFERQKLSRRDRTAKSANIDKDVVRIESEIAALKTLDYSASAQLLLHKTLGKIKAVSASDLFAVYLETPLASIQEIAAQNIHSRLCSSKPVKEALNTAVDDILQAAHIQSHKGPQKEKESKGELARKEEKKSKSDTTREKTALPEEEGESGEDTDEHGGHPLQDVDSDDDFADYQDRLASSDEENEDDLDIAKLERQLKSEGIPEDELSESDFSDLDEKPKPKRRKEKILKPTSSILLPSLTMGGYISASDGSEVEEIDEPPRKNRPGQRARQAIWEKKFGQRAKHLQSTGKGRDEGWDMKRGATGPRHGGRADRHERPVDTAPVRKPAKKDNTGPLHPSWEAAKRAKEQKSQQVFTGKKISFD